MLACHMSAFLFATEAWGRWHVYTQMTLFLERVPEQMYLQREGPDPPESVTDRAMHMPKWCQADDCRRMPFIG